ncbi:unnamed protein product [Rotaria magnacalcarata]|uniref:Uncharacterized protein n=6 Tax=Rotaria magnacalcarata TaxID=392030 RepID=A0A816X580_9BILA|nr:unnamed protein product [Rotaria magnacalcarata]CAF2139939.1 unnamed protein product [Rotaria magnacalcarata]CAF2142057.1 unnamed protein product [Rotaria magnacalcarata]CAF3996677.1 unnamed protein product [Rotaria magnacalcarata]
MDQPASNPAISTYTGSRLLSPIADMAGLPIDQFNFLLSEIVALILAMCFRRFLPPKPSNTFARHLVASLLGIAISHFCFGAQIWHLIIQSSIVYLMLLWIPPKHSYLIIFIFCMIYMSAVHIHRLIYDYGNYTLDISGPLMINTQKLTALAFAFYDGYRSKERAKGQRSNEEHLTLSDDQEKQKITDIPTPIEFLSYIFYFHGICVGPLCFFKDYCDFVEGRNLLVIPTSKISDEQEPIQIEQPSIFWPLFTKLSQCVIWGYFLLAYTPYYPVEFNLSKEMVSSPWFKRLCYLLFSTFCARVKYYFAFILSETVNNAAGLGFAGFDKNGIPQWNLLTNVKPLQLELATSLKVTIDVWNMQTALWLRRVCYDRIHKGRTLGVFVLSALWHGFYPGYYVCFILGAFETYAGRGIRRQIRPYFQKNQATKSIYACITWLGTQIALNFAVTPFVLMEIQKVWYFYETWYFIVPIVSVILALTLKGASSKPKKNQ